MSYLLKYFGRGFMKFLPFMTKYGSLGLSAVYLLVTFVIGIFKYGFVQSFAYLAKSIFGAELIINEGVTLAVKNDPSYNFGVFLSIVFSFIILYSLVKHLSRFIRNMLGANKSYGENVISILIVMLISTMTAYAIDSQFGFFSVKDSIIYLIYNINPVLANIF